MLKIYTDTNFLTEEFRKSVFPLLFDLHFLKNAELLKYYKLVDEVVECEIVVLPIDYSQFIKHAKPFKNLLELAKKHDKPIWIYTAGDYGFTTYIKNSYTFRLGGFNSTLTNSTLTMPSFVNDPYLSYLPNGFSALKKEPSIGFVGHAKSGFLNYMKEFFNHLKYKVKRSVGFILADVQPFYPSSIKRGRYINKLKRSEVLKTNFILRNNYRAGAHTEADKQKSTQEFYNNIFNNAYTFCSRGVGNFSVRFYETLAVGRIPVLLNTDCRLPLEDSIDWSKHIVVLDDRKKESLEQQILTFHNLYNHEGFQELQISNRKLWESYFRRPSYFIEIHDTFLKKMN
ncbi:exostosin family protein [Mariniflexile sp. AS56]|uniref:exostosin domain-containing protein n=1 Tax=Mariniflexile sp. AS56 TaxID=3063957 RepID=UPI0026EFDFDC|nr:exostosin family protein [Mariniflexile sp. AS56]MDO7172710.1 exostosin family protein [Mariniflexile sp. AS56]